jgi:hypothetical protein
MMNPDPWIKLDLPQSKGTVTARRVDSNIVWNFFWARDTAGKCLLILRHSSAAAPDARLPLALNGRFGEGALELDFLAARFLWQHVRKNGGCGISRGFVGIGQRIVLMKPSECFRDIATPGRCFIDRQRAVPYSFILLRDQLCFQRTNELPPNNPRFRDLAASGRAGEQSAVAPKARPFARLWEICGTRGWRCERAGQQ